MKKVFYICTDEKYPIGEDINAIMRKFYELGFKDMPFDLGKTFKKDTQVYYDNFNHSQFSRSLAFYGGFLRQVYSEKQDGETERFIDYKPFTTNDARRFKIDKYVTADEIQTALKIKGKLVPVFSLETSSHKLRLQKLETDLYGSCIEIGLQQAKITTDAVNEPVNVMFITLADKTRMYFGEKAVKRFEEDVNSAFEVFRVQMEKFEPVFSKYKTILNLIGHDKIAEIAPF